MTDVAIVGIGMHPFGRTDGMTGMEQGAVADSSMMARAAARPEMPLPIITTSIDKACWQISPRENKRTYACVRLVTGMLPHLIV